MNTAIKAAIFQPQSFRAVLFHSTSVLERKRRTSWQSRSNSYNKRFRRVHGKQELLRNLNAYAEQLFQSWRDDFDEDDASPSRRTSWFKKQYSKGSRRPPGGNQGPQRWDGRRFEFCEEDDDVKVEKIFHSAFGGSRFFFWSFVNDEDLGRRRSSSYSNYGRSWKWSYRIEEEEDFSTDSESSDSDMASDRLALGLSPSGPLNLDDVKIAYRTCALKWHPDRHQGSSKAVAEEKFKLCSAAYQSLCDKLAVD